MTSKQRAWLIASIILLGVVEIGWLAWQAGVQAAQQIELQKARLTPPPVLPPGQPRRFSHAEIYAFLDSAKKAEALADPLARCVGFPDPPHSHWSASATGAYCRYYLQPTVSFAQVQSLIENGQAAELDRQLADALHAQQTMPQSIGLLDRTYFEDFDNGAFDIRPILDAWKRESPNSAFAYAASGLAYVAMARKARGAASMDDTPPGNIDAMQRLLVQAVDDLTRGIALDPKVTPAHVALIEARQLGGTLAAVQSAARQGVAAAPADYSIYSAWIRATTPRWGGTYPQMRSIATAAAKHANANPLLLLLASEVPADQLDAAPQTAKNLALFPAALDHVSSVRTLDEMARAAADVRAQALAVVYFSEALRFDPAQAGARQRRIRGLLNFDEAAWAARDATTLIAASPRDPVPLRLRAHAYEVLGEQQRAEQDLLAWLAMYPRDRAPLLELIDLYVNWSQQWDKAWNVATQLSEEFPADPSGCYWQWQIEQRQPRAGLGQTTAYFAAHFGTDPADHKLLLRMRAALALQRGAEWKGH